MATRKQRARLILSDDVERVLDDLAIQCLAKAASLPRSADMTRFGRLSQREMHDIAVQTLEVVVRPCAEALLDQRPNGWPSNARTTWSTKDRTLAAR